MDTSSKSFKALNRLFAKASATGSNSSRNGSGIGQDVGQNTVLNGRSTSASIHQATFGAGVGGSNGSGDNEWRDRLRAKLQQGSVIGGGSIGNNSPAGLDGPATPVSDTLAHNQQQQLDEATETPLTTLRVMLRSTNSQDKGEGIEKALFWLDMMVQSGVQVPIQAFMDCCEGLVDIAQRSSLLLASSPSPRPPATANVTPAVDAASPATSFEQSTTMPSAVMASQLVEQSKEFLKTCWVHIVSAAHRMSETEACEILDMVLTTNRDRIFKVMNEGLQSVDTKDLENQQGRHSLPRTGGQLPLQQQLHHRQQPHSFQLVELSRDSVPINIFLSSLRSPSLSLQGEVVKGLAAILEHAQRVSNMDEFADSIHKEIVPCLWELLSPVNDHMADTTLSFLMRFISHRPGFFHKTIARCFSSLNWETRFSALDPVFGLFSKLDDDLVVKLFFQQPIPTTSPQGTMLSSKGSHSHSQNQNQSSIHQQQHYQQALTYSQFLPEHFQILGPVFSFFVSSMWDKEEAVRTKAKTLLKSLQPVHVCHALKAWELYFISSPPEVQQTLLKLMTRLNNYFPSWKIMEYGLVFKLLTSGGLGRFVTNSSDASLAGDSETDSAASSVHGDKNAERGTAGAATDSHKMPKSREQESKEMNARRVSFASLSLWDAPGGILSKPGDGDERQARAQNARIPSVTTSSAHDELSAVDASPPTVMAFMPAGEPSRRQQRVSIASTVKSTGTSASSDSAMVTGAGDHEKQLELEDDIHCSLLNLALQMVANGIEPRLDEVIQLKYLVVFYLDFEGCELLSLGHAKFQVRYGEYIPRQRVSPIYDGVSGDGESLNGANVLLNDPGHENFVLAICRNLQLILDRYVEIKPDNEKDPPTLYDRLRSRDSAYDGGTMSGDPQMQSPQAARTFSATTTASADITKDGDEEYDQEHQSRRQGLFCFARSKHQDDHHAGDSFTRQSTVLPFGQYASPRYQQHQHHHYRRNQSRRMDDNTPVVGTYFVDVILRFFGSETDLSVLPASRLKNWLELLLIVIYKYVKEADPLSDLVIVLMKRIVEMLMVKKGGHATSAAAATHAAAGTGGSGGVVAVTDSENNTSVATAAGEESMSEENTLLAISICSTLLKRSSTMTTALLSREIMAMGKLMTRRREDPEDPVLVRAMNFLHDAFVHFIGNGLFVLVFKTQPAHNTNSFSWEDEGQEVNQELDLFYVLATVLGENEMVSPDPTNTSPAANAHLVHFRDQPIRDILDRVTIFRDLEPAQVSTILTNLALYVERVHSKFEDPHLLPDIGQFLIKVTKYTAEWDHQQQQKHKEHAQQYRQAQEQLQHRQLLQQQLQMKLHGKQRASNHLLSGNTSTVVSNGSSVHLQLQHQSQTPQQRQKYKEKSEIQQQEMQQQKQGVMSMTSGSTIIGAGEPTATAVKSPPQSPFVEAQMQNLATSVTMIPTTGTSSSLSSSSTPAAHGQKQSHQQTQLIQQSTVLSSVTSESSPPPHPPISRPSFVRQKSNLLKNMTSFDLDGNPFSKSRQNRQNVSHDESQASSIHLQYHSHPHHRLHHQHHPQHQGFVKRWYYSNPVLGMCAILMIHNPLEGHHLISAVKHVLRQALYRDKISAPALIRLVTGYCFMAELDFSLSLVNIFGEFVVEELKSSIQNHLHVKHDDEQASRDGEDGNEDLENHAHRPNRHGRFKKNGKGNEKEKESPLEDVGGHGGAGGVGGVNLSFGGSGYYTSGRTKILASNLHLLHHLLIWDLDPSYNLEWTSIKWDILGSMRFPPGHPILFPGADDALRQETASIVSEWVDRNTS
ncbi:hypothetical protein EDD21DRAFT_44445 [Dissophora ornata]|nr:hypothetical protein EDD21DRAFT_44445 [Dissophora ornata]